MASNTAGTLMGDCARHADGGVARTRMLALVGSVLVCVSGSACATVFCVGTGNELSTAMETAAYNDQNDEIHIRTGTLKRSGAVGTVPRWEYNTGAGSGDVTRTLTLSGGWTDCNTQVDDPRLTVLDAEYQGSAVQFMVDNTAGTINVRNLTITRGYHTGNVLAGSAGGGDLGVFAPFSTSTVVLERLIVVAGQSNASDGTLAGGILIIGGGGLTVTLRNNVIAYNTGASNAGLYINTAEAAISVNNNSIFSNTMSSTTAHGVGLHLINATGSSYVANNVIVDNRNGSNVAQDLDNALGNTYLRNNHIGALTLSVAPVVNLNPTTGDPGWTLVGIYPIPNLASPLRDSGTNAPNGGVGALDLAGNARIVNTVVDRGAIEAALNSNPDLIFKDGFQ